MVKAGNTSIKTLLWQAKELFETNRFARMDGLPGWAAGVCRAGRPVDLSKAERFQDLQIDLQDQGGTGAFAIIGGTAPLQLSIAQSDGRKPVDPQTTIQSLRMKNMLVSFRRPWFHASLFQYAGWYLSQQASGFWSSGDIGINSGVLPLLPTGMLLAKDVRSMWPGATRTERSSIRLMCP